MFLQGIIYSPSQKKKEGHNMKEYMRESVREGT